MILKKYVTWSQKPCLFEDEYIGLALKRIIVVVESVLNEKNE